MQHVFKLAAVAALCASAALAGSELLAHLLQRVEDHRQLRIGRTHLLVHTLSQVLAGVGQLRGVEVQAQGPDDRGHGAQAERARPAVRGEHALERRRIRQVAIS